MASAADSSATRHWEALEIPGATCGDGAPYKVFVSAGDPRRITFDLMGGGGCWSFSTCIGPTPMAWLHPIPLVPETDGFVSNDPASSPAAGSTMVYFPYCTGDAHAGDHVARYGLGSKVHHAGRRNFRLALAWLQDSGTLDLRNASGVILYGASAGALGALIHLKEVDAALGPDTERVLLADAPGLHFGDRFWSKFSPEYLHDLDEALRSAGVELDRSHGNIARVVPSLCQAFPRWRVGILQGSRDVVMSTIFGNISPDEHERLIFSAEGLYGLTENPDDNCAAFVPSTSVHMFLPSGATAKITASDGMKAMDFAFAVARGTDLRNHR